MIAVCIGLLVVNAIQPGKGTVDPAALAKFKGVGVDSPKQKMLRKLSELTGMPESEVGSVFEELPTGENEAPSVGQIFEGLALMVFTDNLFQSAANADLVARQISNGS